MQPKLHHKLRLQGDWVLQGINGLPVPCFPPSLSSCATRGGHGSQPEGEGAKFGIFQPRSILGGLSFSNESSVLLPSSATTIVESKKIQAKQAWILYPSTLYLHMHPSLWYTDTHSDTHAVPPLLPPGDVTLLLVGSLIPFLTF